MTTDMQRRALGLLAEAQYGRTVADMLAHGFTNTLLDGLARHGLAAIKPGTVRTGTRRDYGRLGDNHRSRSASACEQAASAG